MTRFSPGLRSLSLSLSLAASMTTVVGAAAAGPPTSPAVARAGDLAITASDVASRVAVIQVREPGNRDSTRALTELLLEALESEVARAVGAALTAEDIEAFGRHAAASSRDPLTLARLQGLLDREGFTRHVLAPRATTLKLRHLFEAEPTLRDLAYDSWYRDRALRIPIVLLDRSSASAICTVYLGVWWLERPCAAFASDGAGL